MQVYGREEASPTVNSTNCKTNLPGSMCSSGITAMEVTNLLNLRAILKESMSDNVNMVKTHSWVGHRLGEMVQLKTFI